MKDTLKKVVIISPGLSTGGAERVSALLANYLQEKGHSITFIATRADDKNYSLDEGINYLCVDDRTISGIRKLIAKNKKISTEIKNGKADVMISFVMIEAVWSIFTLPVKKIISLRCDPRLAYRGFVGLIFRILRYFVYGSSDVVVFQTKDAKEYFPNAIQKKGVIISNPITANLPSWKDFPHKRIIMTAGRLELQKNINMLIEAFSMLYRDFPDYQLNIFGKGSLEEELKELCERKGISEAICFKGYSSELHYEMAQSSIFVMSSDYEGISNAMLEALGIGIPTICTDCPAGGARAFIKSYENGILIPVGDVNALYQEMKNIIENPSLQEQLAKNAIKIRETLEIHKICSKWEEAM